MITTRELARLIALVEHRQFGRAAEAVGISQPAMTRCIALLEERLGEKVVDRGRWGVELTEIGRLIADRGREILRQSIDLEHEIEQLRGLDKGELTVTFAPYAAEVAGQEAVFRLTASHPTITCHIRASDWRGVAEDVLEGRSEIGFADLREARSNTALQTAQGFRHPLYFFCRAGHPLLDREPLEFSDLMDYPWAATRAPLPLASNFPQDLGRAGRWLLPQRDFLPAVELDVIHNIAKIALRSEIVIVAIFSIVESEVASGDLVTLPIDLPWFHTEYGLISRKHRTLSPIAREFAEQLEQIATEVTEREEVLRDRYWKGPS